MYPSNPYDKEDERHNAWESLNHPHGEEYVGQYDYERELLRRDADYDEAGYDESEEEE